MTFEQIQQKACGEWQAFEESEQPRILVGAATCGRSAGALQVLDALGAELEAHGADVSVTQVGCLGLCYLEPLVDILKPGRPRICYGPVTPDKVPELVRDCVIGNDVRPDLALGTFGAAPLAGIPRLFDLPMLKPQLRVILRNCGTIDPENIDHYIAHGGYAGFARALSMSPEAILREVENAGLRGRGGAGFPTAVKWRFCQKAPGQEKYLVCNADEGDPGAFMNRSVLEGDPHSVLEGVVIAARTVGATQGYVYCRAEYPLALHRLRIALSSMRDYGLLGKNILGSGFDFDIAIKEGAGAFVCGEETALMASIEGKRGMPRPRPPFPAQSGIWGKPTNINNVETLAAVSAILQNSAEWYAQYGTDKSRGTKTFALAGKIHRTGLIEVPLGITLRQIIYDIGGGIAEGREFKAVQTGGPSGGCLSDEHLDLPVDYETLTQAGSIMGSGGIIVADEDTCIVDFARFFLRFTQAESCGKCPPCRIGTRQMLGLLDRITCGQGTISDLDKLRELAQTARDASLCALGGTAPNPVLTTLRYFYDEYRQHIEQTRCPALMCKDLISYYILPDKCEGCMICLRNCPSGAITGDKRMVHVINQDKCTRCGTCLEVCPPRFGAVVKVSGEEVEVPSQPVPVSQQRS